MSFSSRRGSGSSLRTASDRAPRAWILLSLLAVSAGALLVGPVPLGAQTLTTGLLTGFVRDQGGEPLADVELTLTDREAGGSRLITTGRDGAFRFTLLPPGSYTVRADRLGFHPRVIEGVPLRPGDRLDLEVRLTPAPPAGVVPEVERFASSFSGSRAGFGQWLSTIRLDALPWERRELGEVAALSSLSTDALEIEGLPSSLSTLMVDGVPFAPVRHPHLDRGDAGILALPLSAFEAAELVTADPDMEWSGFASGALSLHTRRGASELLSRSFASWSGGPLRSSRFIDGSSPSNSSLWGGALISGPIITDTAHFVIGFEGRRIETPRPRPWGLDETAGSVISAGRDAHSIGLEAYTRPYVLQTTVGSAFGRFDWLLGNANTLSVRASFGSILDPARDTELARAALPGAVAKGGDVLFSASLSSLIGNDLAYELRVGVTRGTREYEEGVALLGGSPVLPSTVVTEGGLRFGADPRLPGTFERTGFTTAQSIEVSSGDHRVQFGIETDVAARDDSYVYGRRGAFAFGGADQFARGEGALVHVQIGSPRASYTRLGFAAYVQDTWNAGPGLSVLAGVRLDLETLPSKDLRLSQRWLDYTGIDNTLIEDRVATLSPRIGVTWDVGGDGLWIVRASAGAYAFPVAPEVISEVMAMDGTPTVRRLTGGLADWPSLPSPGATIWPARLSLLGPGFRGPYTGRATFGVSRHVSGGTTVHVSAAYRETEFLPRRSDLNRLGTSTTTDQYGRPVFGPLVKAGELVASPKPNRRFGDFDIVSAINADGWSRYWGVTGAIEHDAGQGLALFARYTYSRTTDNWLARSEGGPDSQLSPFPENTADDWREGTSDFDLTHQLAAGAELTLPGSLQPRIGGVYRYRSGYPFTPGFRTGVDVNADGSWQNDPAFVDESVSGASNVIRSWDCLRSQTGRFAERNSCREPGVHTLDLRFALSLVRSDGLTADVVAEGLNLADPALGEVDAALYRIDGTRPLVEDQARRTITVPLIANPDFGTRLGRIGTGRTLRLGIQVSF